MISDLKLNRKLDNLHNPPLHTAKTSSWGRRWILEHLRSPWRGQGSPFTQPTPQLSCRTRPPHSFRQIYLSSSQELKEHGYWGLQNLYKLPWGWSKGIVVHSPEQLQQKQQNLEWIWILYHMQIILTSASPCKRTLCTDLNLQTHKNFMSLMPSQKHTLLISYYAAQTARQSGCTLFQLQISKRDA